MSPKDRSVKRTTIILDEEEREYIDSLINQGREPGIKPLISKMLDVSEACESTTGNTPENTT